MVQRKIKLSILDQSIVRKGSNAMEALNETIATAKLAERLGYTYNSGRIVSGSLEQVKEQLIKLASDFDIDEIVVATMTYSKEDRFRSFELLAEAFELEG